MNLNKNSQGYDSKRFFDNGYGISIIWKPNISYGWEKGLFEIAVLKGNKDAWEIDYTTPITEDVIGYLDKTEVEDYIEKIKNLK